MLGGVFHSTQCQLTPAPSEYERNDYLIRSVSSEVGCADLNTIAYPLDILLFTSMFHTLQAKNIKPTHVILGADVYTIVRASVDVSRNLVLNTHSKDGSTGSLFGLNLIVDSNAQLPPDILILASVICGDVYMVSAHTYATVTYVHT